MGRGSGRFRDQVVAEARFGGNGNGNGHGRLQARLALWPAGRGVLRVPERCPKCGGVVEAEVAFARCRLGCGAVWVVIGAAVAGQQEFERRSALSRVMADGEPTRYAGEAQGRAWKR